MYPQTLCFQNIFIHPCIHRSIHPSTSSLCVICITVRSPHPPSKVSVFSVVPGKLSFQIHSNHRRHEDFFFFLSTTIFNCLVSTTYYFKGKKAEQISQSKGNLQCSLATGHCSEEEMPVWVTTGNNPVLSPWFEHPRHRDGTGPVSQQRSRDWILLLA